MTDRAETFSLDTGKDLYTSLLCAYLKGVTDCGPDGYTATGVNTEAGDSAFDAGLGRYVWTLGSDEYLSLNTFGSWFRDAWANGFTIFCRFKYTDVSARHVLAGSLATGPLTGFQLCLNSALDGTLTARVTQLAVYGDSGSYYSRGITPEVANLNDGNWHTIIAKIGAHYDAATTAIKIDGNAQSMTRDGNTPAQPAAGMANALAMGARNIAGTPSLYLSGSICDLMIWSKVTSSAEDTILASTDPLYDGFVVNGGASVVAPSRARSRARVR